MIFFSPEVVEGGSSGNQGSFPDSVQVRVGRTLDEGGDGGGSGGVGFRLDVSDGLGWATDLDEVCPFQNIVFDTSFDGLVSPSSVTTTYASFSSSSSVEAPMSISGSSQGR